MKTRFLIIIVGIISILAVTCVIAIETYQGQIEWKEKVGGLKDTGETVDKDNSPIWVSLPMTSHSYPWHGSNYPEHDLHFEEYKSKVKDYDPSSPQDMMLWFHYLIVRYYEDQGIPVFDVKTSRDSSLIGTDIDGTPHLGATWHLKISPSDLDYFLNDGFAEYVDDFDKTWGGPGNRHPAFLGFDIPEICTEDMLKHLVRYSSMFDKGVPYFIEGIGLDDGINMYDFDRCVEELLERNPKELENEN